MELIAQLLYYTQYYYLLHICIPLGEHTLLYALGEATQLPTQQGVLHPNVAGWIYTCAHMPVSMRLWQGTVGVAALAPSTYGYTHNGDGYYYHRHLGRDVGPLDLEG